MKILLTGASGFLGAVIKKVLHAHEMITLGRSGQDINVDLSKKIPVLPCVDMVIHAAGKAHIVPKTDDERADFFNVNVAGTKNLLEGFVGQPMPRSFIFISSVAVYGLSEGTMIREDFPLNATDPYGRSKIEAEKIVSEWATKNNIVLTILRLPLIAAPSPPGNLGAMIKGIAKGYYFNVKGNDAKKSIVLAADVAAIIPQAADIGGTYNLTDNYHPSFSEMSYLIADQLKKSRPTLISYGLILVLAKIGNLFGPNMPLTNNKLKKIISTLTFDDSSAVEKLGWRPRRVLDEFRIR